MVISGTSTHHTLLPETSAHQGNFPFRGSKVYFILKMMLICSRGKEILFSSTVQRQKRNGRTDKCTEKMEEQKFDGNLQTDGKRR
jgi:hypothetical protein